MTTFHEHRVNNFDEMSKQHASILLCQAYTRAMLSTRNTHEVLPSCAHTERKREKREKENLRPNKKSRNNHDE